VTDEKSKPAGRASAIDEDLIRQLAKLLEETHLSEIEIECDDFKVRVARHSAGSFHAPAAPPAPHDALPSIEARPDVGLASHPGVVKSPMVGTAYRSPKPGDPPFVNEGDMVSEGQTLMIVEAMKTMNAILAPRGGRVAKILVANEQPVEFGEPLLVVE